MAYEASDSEDDGLLEVPKTSHRKPKEKDERSFWVADAETDPFKYGRVPKPFIWGVYTGAGFHTFEDTLEFVDFIKGQDVIVYFHNGGKFDLHLILEHVNVCEEVKIINGRIAVAHIGRAEIRDSYLLFPAPLSEFGAKLSIDYKKMEKKVRHLHMSEIKVYLKADCVELWQALYEHERLYGRHLTQAGASMAQWQKLSGLSPPKTDKAFFDRFSEYYYGGRVQCFQKGYIKGPIEVKDIRSAYPWAMLSEHPYDPLFYEIPQPTYSTVRATDMVTVSCISTGALPFRDSRGIITYPRDKIRRKYKVPGHEIMAAVETGAAREVFVHHVIRFASLKDFKPYIHHFYEGRKDDRRAAKLARDIGDEVAARLHDVKAFFKKRYMTGLYGKFGANPGNYGNFFIVPWEDKMRYMKGDDLHPPGDLFDGKRDYRFNGKLGPYAVLRDDLDTWQEHYINVATAASITSQVRAHLWCAIDGSDDPIYCDTDCVMARSSPDLPVGEELGEWNLEGVATDVYIGGKKLYYLKGSFGKKRFKMASKGVQPDPKKIKAVALGKTVLVKNDAPTFTLSGSRGVYFQARNIRMTADVGEPV